MIESKQPVLRHMNLFCTCNVRRGLQPIYIQCRPLRVNPESKKKVPVSQRAEYLYEKS